MIYFLLNNFPLLTSQSFTKSVQSFFFSINHTFISFLPLLLPFLLLLLLHYSCSCPCSCSCSSSSSLTIFIFIFTFTFTFPLFLLIFHNLSFSLPSPSTFPSPFPISPPASHETKTDRARLTESHFVIATRTRGRGEQGDRRTPPQAIVLLLAQ